MDNILCLAARLLLAAEVGLHRLANGPPARKVLPNHALLVKRPANGLRGASQRALLCMSVSLQHLESRLLKTVYP